MIYKDNEVFASNDLAELLKQIGFDCDSHYYFDYSWGRDMVRFSQGFCNWNVKSRTFHGCTAPTLAMAQRWFREFKGIHVEVTTEYIGQEKKFMFRVRFFSNNIGTRFHRDHNGISIYMPNYEQALEVGLVDCCKYLIENDLAKKI